MTSLITPSSPRFLAPHDRSIFSAHNPGVNIRSGIRERNTYRLQGRRGNGDQHPGAQGAVSAGVPTKKPHPARKSLKVKASPC